MPGGIVAQYGFLYQRIIFVNTALSNMGMGKRFVFEGADDIDVVSDDDKIFRIVNEKEKYIQVKSGTVSKECMAKVIGNWLLLECVGVEDGEKYKLLLENALQYDITNEDIQREIQQIYIDKSGKKKSSICKRVYDKYKNDIESGNFLEMMKDFVRDIEIEICAITEVEEQAFRLFQDNYCDDIVVYDIAKRKRYERFKQYLFAEIDESIKSKKQYALNFAQCIHLIEKCREEISDKQYKVSYKEFKTRNVKLAKQIVDEASILEVEELKRVNPDEKFVINEIIKELLYKDFRNVYAEPRPIDIANIEQAAKENYDMTRFELDNDASPKKIFIETTKKTITHSLLEDSPLYRNGCYVYLTSDEVGEDVRITWRVDDE